MGYPLRSITDAAAWRTANTSEMHNASVDEDAARAGECAQVHLPTGRICTLPHGHARSCEFISAEAAAASLAHRGPTTAGNRPDRGGERRRALKGQQSPRIPQLCQPDGFDGR